jgi:hypothetical protein
MDPYSVTLLFLTELLRYMTEVEKNLTPDRRELAIRWLQRVLRVDRTGRIDAPDVGRIEASRPVLVDHALIAPRLQMIDMATDSRRVNKRFEEGLENRALTFSLLEVP